MEIAKAKVANALTSAASDHVIAVAADVYDENKEKYQSTLNQEFDARLGDIESGTSGGGGELTENSVDTQHIKNGAVTEDKLSDEVKNKLNQTGGGGTSFSGSAADVTYEGSLDATNVKDALDKLNEEKVDREDNAPKLTAGFANNLVGRGEATKEVIGFRPSGGDTSIEDGTARIDKIKGETVVWNQLVEVTKVTAQFDKPLYTLSFSDGIISVSKSEGGTTTGDNIWAFFSHNFIASRKYIIVYNLKRNDGQNSTHYIGGTGIYDGTKYHAIPTVEGDYKFFSPTESFTSTQIQISQTVLAGVALSYTLRPVIHDLTQMFGAGNEPTTIEEFNARKPIGIDEYAYNEGELISTTADEIKSVGFNAWDEEWEQGGMNLDGVLVPDITRIRTKNPIRVIPSARYNIESGGKTIGFRFYDKDDNHLGTFSNYNATDGTMTIPKNAYYMRFSVVETTTYNHDICIHLVHTGYRNGEYEPYKEFRRSLPISEIKDSDGNQLFPNGLLSAGSAHDEITATKAIKRIGVVDMGTLDWKYASTYTSYNFYADVRNYGFAKELKDTSKANILNALYATSSRVGSDKDTDKTIKMYENVALRLKDTSYTDTATFKAAMSGVMLYYELAEPIEVDLPEPLNLDYEVSDFGTEEVISDVPTTQLKADIIYQFNAVDRIRDNSRHTAEAEVTLDNLQKGQLNLTVKDNGNIVLSNTNGVSKEFMPATPSGDPMHYAYVAAGAEWNDTDATITKTLETVSYDDSHYETFSFEHKPKCWYLNGIGNITNDEMRAIYNYPHYAKYTGAYAGIEQKTVIFDGNGPSSALNLSYWFSGAAIGSLIYKKSIYASNVTQMFYNTYNLEYLLPANKRAFLYGYEGFKATDLSYGINNKWKEIRIYILKKSCDLSRLPNISKNSVLYAINTCKPTTAITITLHADAYARLGEDADVLAALEAKNAALQGTGGSISLVSA